MQRPDEGNIVVSGPADHQKPVLIEDPGKEGLPLGRVGGEFVNGVSETRGRVVAVELHDGCRRVVLADPETVIAQRLAMLSQFEGAADGLALRPSGARHGLIENGKSQVGCHAASLP